MLYDAGWVICRSDIDALTVPRCFLTHFHTPTIISAKQALILLLNANLPIQKLLTVTSSLSLLFHTDGSIVSWRGLFTCYPYA